MIEVLKQALEALYPISHNSTDDYRGQADKAIASLRQAIAKAEDNYQGSDAAKAAHMMDLYTALGVRWGDNPFAVIAKMRSIAELESQEPVAWRRREVGGGWQYFGWQETGMTHQAVERGNKNGFECEAIPATTPQRSESSGKPSAWVGLTEEQRNDIEDSFGVVVSKHVFDAIEAKLKERNT